MDDRAIETRAIVEFYQTSLTTPENIVAPAFHASGRLFQRTIYRPIAGEDVLVKFTKEFGPFYHFNSTLSRIALRSRHHFRQSISVCEPSRDQRIIPSSFSNIFSTWNNVAAQFSACIGDSVFEGGVPFVFQGVEAYGIESIRREDSNWEQLDWRQNLPTQIDTQHMCGICHEDINEIPNHDILALHMCQHLFHKRCFYSWIWEDNNNRRRIKCPLCREEL